RADWDDPPREYAQGHCLDFYGGDLPGIEQRLNYLQEIGVSAIYLNPIFRGKTTHRYDCIDYFHVDEHLGGDDALVSLVEAAHSRNMKVIVDVSINHTGVEHEWLKTALANPGSREHSYYYWNEDGSFSGWEGFDTLPQLNHGSPELQEVLYTGTRSLVRYYLQKPFQIDGWRFDVGNHTGNHGTDNLSHQVWKLCRQAIKDENPEAYIVGEHWEDAERYLQGDQWDTAMNYFASGRPLRRFIGAMDRFMTPDEDPHRRIKPIGGDLAWQQMQQHFGRIPNQLTWVQFNLLDSHDIWRLHNLESLFNMDVYRGIIAILYTLPGTMNIYYGDEIGIPGTVETVEGCRYPMRWEQSDWKQEFLTLYRSLSRLKQSEPALHFGSLRCLYADDETLVLSRFTKDRTVISVLNRASESRSLEIPVAEIGLTSVEGLNTVAVSDRIPNPPRMDGTNLVLQLKAAEPVVFAGNLRGK
ncbi:MAG: glycoside hydrolase family 13 protein, partial [Spirochaeta sp.]